MLDPGPARAAAHRPDPGLARLYVRERGPALARVRRLVHDPDDAEDVVHDAFVRVIGQWPGRSTRHSTVAWLHTVARNCAIDLVRARTRRPAPVPLRDDAVADAPRRDEERVLPDVVDAVERLPRSLALPLLLHALDDKSLDEISTLTRTTPGNVRVRIHRARRLLRRRRPDPRG